MNKRFRNVNARARDLRRMRVDMVIAVQRGRVLREWAFPNGGPMAGSSGGNKVTGSTASLSVKRKNAGSNHQNCIRNVDVVVL